MDEIKVSEVSAIPEEGTGRNQHIKLEEVGTVLQVSDGVVRIYRLDNAESNELLQFDNGMETIVMNLEEDNVGAVLLGPTDQIKEGDTVKRTGRIASIDVGEGMMGRVIDPLGNQSTEKVRLQVQDAVCLWSAKHRASSSVSL